jgi:hypothetical protein
MLTMTEFLTRHGDILTIVQVVEDPIYMDEPYVESTTYTYDLTTVVNLENCISSPSAENGGLDPHHVPHFLPGQNTYLTEWLEQENWVPVEATRGGFKTMYPEYRSTLDGSVKVADLKVPSSKTSNVAEKRIADQSPKDGEIHVLPVQGNVYMIVADGTNLVVSIGIDGRQGSRDDQSTDGHGKRADNEQMLWHKLSRDAVRLDEPTDERGDQFARARSGQAASRPHQYEHGARPYRRKCASCRCGDVAESADHRPRKRTSANDARDRHAARRVYADRHVSDRVL